MNENLNPINELPPFLNFCYTIGMLPTSYKISMTYEEQVLEAIRYIKEEIIPTVNSNALATKELQEKFVELVNYVETYLDNLDVQNEINNKLDEMAEDGTLTQIIGNYVNPIFENFKDEINNKINLQDETISNLTNSPLIASSVSEMTDTTKPYINTTDGKWYYYNGSEWTIGGTYQTTGIGDETINFEKLTKDVQKNIVDSVRYSDLKNNYREYQPVFVQGRIDVNTGNLVNSNTQISTADFIDVSFFDKIMLKISNKFNVFAFKYDSNKSYLGVINTPAGAGYRPWSVNTILDVSNISFIKIGVAKPDYSNITTSDAVNLQIANINWIKDYFDNNLYDKENILNFEAGGIDINSSASNFGKDKTSNTLARCDFVYCHNFDKVKIIDDYIDNIYFSIIYYNEYKEAISVILNSSEYVLGKDTIYFNIPQNAYYYRLIINDGNSPVSTDNYTKLKAVNIKYGIFKDKKISILGDSLSTYNGYSPTDYATPYYPKNDTRMNNVNRMYWKKVIDELGMVLDTDNSYSSSTVVSNTTYTSLSDDNRLSALGNPDVIIVEGGTNDIYSGKNSSNINSYELNTYDKTKFSEAYVYILNKLTELYPNAKIICLTPAQILYNETYPARSNCTYNRINDICDNIIELARNFGCEYIDLRKIGFNYKNINSMTLEGLHWNSLMHSKVSQAIINKLNEIK